MIILGGRIWYQLSRRKVIKISCFSAVTFVFHTPYWRKMVTLTFQAMMIFHFGIKHSISCCCRKIWKWWLVWWSRVTVTKVDYFPFNGISRHNPCFITFIAFWDWDWLFTPTAKQLVSQMEKMSSSFIFWFSSLSFFRLEIMASIAQK